MPARAAPRPRAPGSRTSAREDEGPACRSSRGRLRRPPSLDPRPRSGLEGRRRNRSTGGDVGPELLAAVRRTPGPCMAVRPRRHFHGDAREHGVAAEAVHELLVGQVVDAGSRVGARPRAAGRPARPWPKPWGRLTTPGRMVVGRLAAEPSTEPAREVMRTLLSVAQAARRGVLRVHEQGAAVAALHQPLGVVHPRVVACAGRGGR